MDDAKPAQLNIIMNLSSPLINSKVSPRIGLKGLLEVFSKDDTIAILKAPMKAILMTGSSD